MTPDQVLAGLSEPQREAARALSGAVLITAGPGAGKTRTITHRIAYGVAAAQFDPVRTLALTFTTGAAGELRSRLARLDAGPVAVRTFHSAALRQLRYFWPDAVGGPFPRIEPDRARLVAEAALRGGLTADQGSVAAMLGELDWAKASGVTATAYAGAAGERSAGDLQPAVVARVLAGYEDLKTEQGVIDFDDVLLITIGLLENRTDLRESVRRAFRWITVDEYQDVSPLQQRLLDLWAGDRPQLCVVGDPAQAIYQFAGADPGLLVTFPRRYRGATRIDLPETFRCAPAIVAAANRVAATMSGALHLRSAAGGAGEGRIQVLQFPSPAAEAAGIADEIAGLLQRGQQPAGLACLYRAHHHGQLLQDELRRRRIPFTLRGPDRFYERPEVKEALARFRGEVRLHPTASAAEATAAVMAAMGHDPEPPDSPTARDRWESLAALAALSQPGTALSAQEQLTRLDARVADQEPPPAAGVSLLTLHAAKGLEWDTVFLVGAGEGSLPYARAHTPEQLAEERRLFYVGVTRARQRLVVTWPAQDGKGARVRPSPYLADLTAATVARPTTAAPVEFVDLRAADPAVDHAGEGRAPARCRICGRSLVTGVERVLGRCEHCPSAADPALLSALTRWRDARAAAGEQPGYAVLTDTTLLAVAEQRPATHLELARIPGMRPDKLAAFGDAVLGVVTAHPLLAQLAPAHPTAAPPPEADAILPPDADVEPPWMDAAASPEGDAAASPVADAAAPPEADERASQAPTAPPP